MNQIDYKSISEEDYNNVCGPNWPGYQDFLKIDNIPGFIVEEIRCMLAESTPQFVFSGTKKDYLNFLLDEYFDILQQKRVLEIAPNQGDHTGVIQKTNPIYHEAIEADKEFADKLTNQYPSVNVFHADIFDVLSTYKKFDVTICFGLLYHLHSPLHLLELIVNNSDPEFVLIDCVCAPKNLKFNTENVNTMGNRFCVNDWKSANFNLVVPFEIVFQSMKHMGYSLVKKTMLNINDNFSKSNSWVGMWKNERTVD